jgi:hypothetical protein
LDTISNILISFSAVILFSCSNKPNFSDYTDINDSIGNLVFKIDPKDSTAIILSKYSKTYMKGKLINGKREGIWTEYVIGGNYKCYEYTFKDNFENGKCYSFTITGKINSVGNRKNGTPHGTFVYFDLKGNPEKIELWKVVEDRSGVSELVYSKDLLKNY